MSNIKNTFKNEKVIIGFVMAGDPNLETTKNVILSMHKAGAGMVELGIPFSDPIAESNVVQSANLRALKSETYLNKVFEMLEELRKTCDIPIIFHSYMNPVFDFGYENFFKRCSEIGIDGLLVPDLPFEEKGEVRDIALKYGVDIISFIVPAEKERMKMIASDASGFIYFVPSISSTAENSESSKELEQDIATIKLAKDIPVALGFAINTAQQAAYFSQKADGIIIGNAIVKIIEKYGLASPEYVYNYVKEIKEAVK